MRSSRRRQAKSNPEEYKFKGFDGKEKTFEVIKGYERVGTRRLKGPTGKSIRCLVQRSLANEWVWLTVAPLGQGARIFIAVMDDKSRICLFYRSAFGTGGKVPGRWYPTGGPMAANQDPCHWVIKGSPAKDPGDGRQELLELYQRVNEIIPQSDEGFEKLVIELTGKKLADFIRDPKFHATPFLHARDLDWESENEYIGMAYRLWSQTQLDPHWGPRVKQAKTNPSAAYDEVAKMLRSMPPDWRSQYMVGRDALRRATGERLPEVPKPEDAVKIIGITAGGNRSGDSPTGPNPVPPQVREEALHGLRLSHHNNYGAWSFIGIARAIQLALAKGVSDTTRSRMSNYFTRHVKDQASSNFGSESHPSRGYMAWLNWGGDSGYAWASGAKSNPTQRPRLTSARRNPDDSVFDGALTVDHLISDYSTQVRYNYGAHPQHGLAEFVQLIAAKMQRTEESQMGMADNTDNGRFSKLFRIGCRSERGGQDHDCDPYDNSVKEAVLYYCRVSDGEVVPLFTASSDEYSETAPEAVDSLVDDINHIVNSYAWYDVGERIRSVPEWMQEKPKSRRNPRYRSEMNPDVQDLKGRSVPERYLAGLPANLKQRRIRELTQSRDAYKRGDFSELPTDQVARQMGLVKPSAYTNVAKARGIEWRGDALDMARRVMAYYGGNQRDANAFAPQLTQVFRKGLAAWKSGGHRPGATAQNWAFARVNSLVVGGKAAWTADQHEFSTLPAAVQHEVVAQMDDVIHALEEQGRNEDVRFLLSTVLR